jgi:hypothetical protein
VLVTTAFRLQTARTAAVVLIAEQKAMITTAAVLAVCKWKVVVTTAAKSTTSYTAADVL